MERELAVGCLVALDMKADYMPGAVRLTREFAFDRNSPTDLLAMLLHRRAEQMTAR